MQSKNQSKRRRSTAAAPAPETTAPVSSVVIETVRNLLNASGAPASAVNGIVGVANGSMIAVPVEQYERLVQIADHPTVEDTEPFKTRIYTAKTLHKHIRTVDAYIRAGLLEAVRSPHGRVIGVTASSLRKFMTGAQGKAVAE